MRRRGGLHKFRNAVARDTRPQKWGGDPSGNAILTLSRYNHAMLSTKAYMLLALAGSGFFSVLQAGTIDSIYAFGDSLSDVGNIYAYTSVNTPPAYPAAPYVNGQFSNGNVWVQDLAGGLGLGPLTPSLLGGTDYAVGGAETSVTPFNLPTSSAGSDLLTGQLPLFESTHATADPNALYTIWIGSNDLNGIFTNATSAQYGSDIGLVAGNIDTAISALAGLGAKNFLVLTVADLGHFPGVLALGPTVSAEASALTAAFDTTLVNGSGPVPSLSALAAADGIDISVLNTYALFDEIAANPSAYGLTNVTQPCLTGEVNYSGGIPCATPNQYLFWDTDHPTAAGHEVVANAALSVVTPEPSSISFIAVGMLGLVIFCRRCCQTQ
jgi:phospholipase/lecithinase/hemolysin